MHTRSNAIIPCAPNDSKKASCGLTATACGATASTIAQQKRATSPRSSTGIRSATGSSPTTSCDRLRSTSAARRSAKVNVATGIPGDTVAVKAEGGRWAAFRRTLRLRDWARPPVGSGLERGLQLAARRELRDRGRRDLDALAGARVDTLARRALRGRELPETREVDRVTGLQGLRHRVHERLDGFPRVARREPALAGDLLNELLLGQELLLQLGDSKRAELRGKR